MTTFALSLPTDEAAYDRWLLDVEDQAKMHHYAKCIVATCNAQAEPFSRAECVRLRRDAEALLERIQRLEARSKR